MKATRHSQPGRVELAELPAPRPAPGEVLLRVRACGVCRTDLHIIDGELLPRKPGVVPGHQVVGAVIEQGGGATRFKIGDRVGVPWLGGTCGVCGFCRSNRENLCDRASYTGYDRDGGFAEYVTADERFCFPIPAGFDDLHAAPLLCAGLIGYRALRFCGAAERIGFYGFGAAAHILTQVAVFLGRRVFAFTRPGDSEGQVLARSLGASWAGDSAQPAPEPLDAAIIFAPVGALVPAALRAVTKGGIVVCAGIHMSEIPAFPYSILWEERSLVSVANLTRAAGDEFLALAARLPVRTEVQTYPLADAQRALDDLRAGRVRGSAVLCIPG